MDRAFLRLELAYSTRVQSSRDEDPDMLVTGLVEPGPNLLHQVDGDPPSLARSVQAHPAESFAESPCDPQRFLRLVLERVDQHYAQHVVAHVLVEGKRCLHGVAEEKDHGVWHRPRRTLKAGELRSQRCGASGASADDGGVLHGRRDQGCTWRAPKLITRLPPAASTISRAAVAQPEQLESMPSSAVS